MSASELTSKEKSYLERMYDGIRREAAGYEAYGNDLLDLMQEISSLATAKIPEQSKEIDQVYHNIQELVIYIGDLVEEQLRASEDIRDILERQKVVIRIANEYTESKSLYGAACQLYDQCIAKTTDDKTIQNRKDQKREALNQLKSKLTEYITAAEKFNAFRDRRMSSAVMRYLRAVHNFHAHENGILKRVKARVVTLSISKLETPPDIEAYLQEFNAFKETAMTPEPHPVFGRFILS